MPRLRAFAAAAALLSLAAASGCGRTAAGGRLHGARGDGGAGDGPRRVTGEALVLIAQVRDARSGAEQGSVQALITPPPHPYFRVARRLEGGCDRIAEPPPGIRQLSAGVIRITGGPQPITLKPERPVRSGELLYPGILFPRVFRAGDTLVARAPGDEVAGFDVRAVAPGRLSVIFPRAISRRSPRAISVRGPRGTVWLTLRAANDRGDTAHVRCRVAYLGDALRGLPLHRGAVAALPAGARAVRVTVGLVTETVSHIGAGIAHVVVADLAEANLPLTP